MPPVSPPIPHRSSPRALRSWGARPDAALWYAVSWAEGRRTVLADALVRALECRVEALAANNELELAISHAREVVRLEPYRESGYRRLMKILERKGERADAIRVYNECVRLLNEELGVPPSEETQAVYREVAG